MDIYGVNVTVVGEINEDEITAYLVMLQGRSKHKLISADIRVNGEYVDIKYAFEHVPFERIRRITGYLVGTTARWGDAKQAELKDRVKHGE